MVCILPIGIYYVYLFGVLCCEYCISCMYVGGDVSEKAAPVSLVNCVQSAFL